MSDPSILVADANKQTGHAFKRLIENEYRYKVSLPQSFDALKECLRSRVYDSAIIDLDLRDWGRPYQMNGHTIHNGRDVARLFRELYAGAKVGVYGSAAAFEYLGIDPTENDYAAAVIIPLPPSLSQIKATLEPFFRKPVLKLAPSVHRANPLFKPFLGESPTRREELLRAYKRACGLNRRWIDFSFETVDDPSWSVVCGGSVEETGAPLNGNRSRRSRLRVSAKEKYPRESETNKIGKRLNSNVYVFWNARKGQFIREQFEDAGPNLRNLPEFLRSSFGIGTADPQAKAYLQGKRDEVIKRCKELTPEGQFETESKILKLLYRHKPSWISDFSARCKAAGLPVLIEIYKGRLESIEPEKQTGWVRLSLWDESRVPLMEPFDLKMLQRNGVRKPSRDLFEYTVYVPFVGGGSASRIEPIERIDERYSDGALQEIA